MNLIVFHVCLGFWRPTLATISEWFRIQSERLYVLYSMTTWGRPTHLHYVRTYTLKTGLTIQNEDYLRDTGGSPISYTGNHNNIDPKTNVLPEGTVATTVTIHPTNWLGGIALRVEINVFPVAGKHWS